MKGFFTRRLVLATVLVAALASIGLTTAQAATPSWETIVSGLDNPRDLAFGADGRLYVAEAGHGGADCVSGGPEGGSACFGFTSRISRVFVGTHTSAPVATGFLSVADVDGSGATGVDGISVIPNGTIYGIITGSAPAVPSEGLPTATADAARAQAGRLIEAKPDGSWKIGAPVGNVDFAWTNDHKDLVPGQFPDANPYGVFAMPGEQWVVDAGANTIDRVRSNTSVDVMAFFPNPPSSDAVPTCIDKGPDGAFYIGELTGGGNVPGSSVVWRYVPGGTPTQWATGLTAVTGCGFSPSGDFYAVEFSTLGLDNAAPGTGALVRVPPHSTAPITVADGLSFPGGFAAGRDAIFLSNWSIAPSTFGIGSVVRVRIG